jgi:DNA-binding IclR family transcriptional regulator
LLAEFEAVRKRGWSEAINARGQGVGAVAVPLFYRSGLLALTMAASAPLTRFGRERRDAICRQLFTVINELSAISELFRKEPA